MLCTLVRVRCSDELVGGSIFWRIEAATVRASASAVQAERGPVNAVIAIRDRRLLRLVWDAIEERPQFTVAAITSDPVAIRRFATTQKLDLLVGDGEAIRGIARRGRSSLRSNGAPVILLAEWSERILEAVLLLRYSDGVIFADSALSPLDARIELASEKVCSLPSSAIPSLLEGTLRAQRVAAMSATETQILELIGAGATNPEISQRLGLPEQAVKATVSRLLLKLGFRSRAEAAVFVASAAAVSP